MHDGRTGGEWDLFNKERSLVFVSFVWWTSWDTQLSALLIVVGRKLGKYVIDARSRAFGGRTGARERDRPGF